MERAIEAGLPGSKLREIAAEDGTVELAVGGLRQARAGRDDRGRSVLQTRRLDGGLNAGFRGIDGPPLSERPLRTSAGPTSPTSPIPNPMSAAAPAAPTGVLGFLQKLQDIKIGGGPAVVVKRKDLPGDPAEPVHVDRQRRGSARGGRHAAGRPGE